MTTVPIPLFARHVMAIVNKRRATGQTIPHVYQLERSGFVRLHWTAGEEDVNDFAASYQWMDRKNQEVGPRLGSLTAAIDYSFDNAT